MVNEVLNISFISWREGFPSRILAKSKQLTLALYIVFQYHYSATTADYQLQLSVLMIQSRQVGPSVNNLVPAIHDGHLEKKVYASSPPGSDLMSFQKFGYKGTILMHVTTEIRKSCDYEGYLQKATKFDQLGLGTIMLYPICHLLN